MEARYQKDEAIKTPVKEGTYCNEHCVFHANDESWNTTSKTHEVLYGDDVT